MTARIDLMRIEINGRYKNNMGAGLVSKLPHPAQADARMILYIFNILIAQGQRNLGPIMLVYGKRNEITSSISSSSKAH